MSTLRFPTASVEMPARFRGRPVLDPSRCENGCRRCAEAVPSALIRLRAAGPPQIDAGACLFNPDEAAACPHGAIAFTRDTRMASTTREGLVTPRGAIELAQALEAKSRKLLGRSLKLRSVVAGSCGGCEVELMALSNVVFDLGRFGVQFVASPRHADGIVITGAVCENMRLALQKTYDAVPDPRLVIAVGACAISGGPFAGSPEVAGGVPPEIPVDLYVPGCPPHPLTLLDGILRLLGEIEDGARS